MSVVPAKKSTLVIVPPVSDAVALTVMLAGAVQVAPLAGAVSDTVGAWLVGVVTVTLLKTAGAAWEESPLATARPTTTFAEVTDIVSIVVHVTPSADCDAVS